MASSEVRPNGTTAKHMLDPAPSWVSGIVPGLAGGFVMALVLIALSVTQKPGPLAPFSLIASIPFGEHLGSGLVAVLVGLTLHTSMAALLGSAFGRLSSFVPRRYQLALGALYALNVWAVVQFLVLPSLNTNLHSPAAVVWPFLFGHLAYGLMLAASLPVADELRGSALVRAAMLPPTIAARMVTETTERVKDVVSGTTERMKDVVTGTTDRVKDVVNVASELPAKATALAIQGATETVQDAVDTMKDVVDAVLPETDSRTPVTVRKA